MYLMSGSIVYTRIPKPRIIYFFLSLVLSVRFHALFIIRLETTQKLFKWPYFCLCSTWRQMNKQGKQISHPLSWQQSIQTKHIGSKPAYLKSNFNYKYVLANMVVSDSHNFNATQFGMTYIGMTYQVLFMPFGRFLLAVESLDLSQADKSILRVTSFPSFTKL